MFSDVYHLFLETLISRARFDTTLKKIQRERVCRSMYVKMCTCTYINIYVHNMRILFMYRKMRKDMCRPLSLSLPSSSPPSQGRTRRKGDKCRK